MFSNMRTKKRRAMDTKRIGFYPVCARDYLEPLQLLKGWVDEVVFCDIKCMPQSANALKDLREAAIDEELPNPSILVGDALVAMSILKPVDLFFLRRDSTGEGGSELDLLGPKRIREVVRVIKSNGMLVTDGTNDRPWFKDFRKGRRNPYQVGDRTIHISDQQPWKDQNLITFIVK